MQRIGVNPDKIIRLQFLPILKAASDAKKPLGKTGAIPSSPRGKFCLDQSTGLLFFRWFVYGDEGHGIAGELW